MSSPKQRITKRDLSIRWLATTSDIEYENVLRIRLAAYIAAAKLKADCVPQAAADHYDKSAAIALLRHRNLPIGTIRIFVAPDLVSCDYSLHPGFSDAFTDLESYVSGSRMAILPEYQGSGLFDVLHDLMPMKAEQNGRQFVLGSASGWVLDRYLRRGWHQMGVAYANSDFGGLNHEFIRLDVASWRARRVPRLLSD